MRCNQCQGPFSVVASGLDVTHSHGLTGLMLACSDCGRPIRLLHQSGVKSAKVDRAAEKRAMRSARRRQMRIA